MKKFIRIFALVLVLVLFLGTLGYLYSKSKPKEVVYETTQAFYTDIIRKTVATGSVVPRNEIEIKPTVSGIIDQINVTEGQMVSVGQVLARVKIVPNMVNLNAAESRVNRAKIALEEARINFNRQQQLFDREVIAESEFIPFRIALNNAEEENVSAENNLQLIRDGASKNSTTTSNTIIRSTISGMILTIPVELGYSVIEANNFNAGTTIVTIADMGQMMFKGKVDESEVGKIVEGMDLILNIGAIDEVDFAAVLEHISPKGVEESGAIQFEIRADIKLDKEHFIRAGYSATADIVLERRDSVLAVEESILIFDNGNTFVEVETEPQTFEQREVKTGISDGINIEIKEGITAEDKIKKKA